MKRKLEQTVGRIAGAHSTVHWSPLVYQYRTLGFDEIVAIYCACDVAANVAAVTSGPNISPRGIMREILMFL